MFDSQKKDITVRIISGGDKSCIVRYPTDQEWAERARRLKMVRQNLGRGISRPVPQKSESVDFDLFQKIRQDKDGCDFTEGEGSKVVGKLEACQVVDISREAGGYKVTLKAGKIETVHCLNSPMADDVIQYDRQQLIREDRPRTTEMRVLIGPAGELYDRLVIKSEGYSGPVPINHKYAVIFELISEIEREEEDPE
jgi:hypothetical protein